MSLLRQVRIGMWLAFLGWAASVSAQSLRSPWDAVKVVASDAAYSCPAPPPFARTLEMGSYYTDPHMSVIDAKKLAAFQEASEAPTKLSRDAAAAADRYLAGGSRAAAGCVYSLLSAAAKAEAWDGKMPSFQGVYEQNWTLSGVGIAYLKVRESGVGSAGQDAAIQRWFKALAGRVRDYFDSHLSDPHSDAWNNHMNWAGLAVGAEAIADNDPAAMEWARHAYAMGISSIRDDGSLPAEMNRAGMALHYHLYALGPLVLLAELGAANGVDFYAAQNGAIHRLAKLCVAGMDDPTIFEKRTGVKQVVPDQLSGTDIGWAVPYARRFPDAGLVALLTRATGTRATVWGGAPPP